MGSNNVDAAEQLVISEEHVRAIGQYLSNSTNPLKGRFRALFTLRNINSPLAIELIGNCFKSEEESSDLLKHELAYCLGQMGRTEGISILENVLRNPNNHPMVRHEAGEALGAIGGSQCYRILEQFQNDPIPEVKETIQLALSRIEQEEDSLSKSKNGDFSSIDPALPFEENLGLIELEKILLDTSTGSNLTQRYKSMFSLRNLNSPEATLVLCKGFKCKDSALFRHEIAFVLGQLQQPVSIPALTEVLGDKDENHMVRHEAAEALGSIGTPECLQILQPYLQDEAQIVRESCEVALDICEYEMNPSEFQYANTLSQIKSN